MACPRPASMPQDSFRAHLLKYLNLVMYRALDCMTQKESVDHPTILVAEDNALLRLNTFELLEEHGYTVVEPPAGGHAQGRAAMPAIGKGARTASAAARRVRQGRRRAGDRRTRSARGDGIGDQPCRLSNVS